MEPRDQAVQALYELDQRHSTAVPADLSAKARRLVVGVLEYRSSLDTEINAASKNWTVDRMPVVDRSILRLGTYELFYEPATPVAVVLNEAVRLAKLFSTEKSGGFVNGVLASISRIHESSAANESAN
jgi:N utilization substance protein B